MRRDGHGRPHRDCQESSRFILLSALSMTDLVLVAIGPLWSSDDRITIQVEVGAGDLGGLIGRDERIIGALRQRMSLPLAKWSAYDFDLSGSR